MIFRHDNVFIMPITATLTERGQISVPASLRRTMRLRPGQQLQWEQISPTEFRVIVTRANPPGPLSVLGYARRLEGRSKPRRTKDWMRELRAGEKGV
jgi:bifunctional DNA-binding transcriptional regulator/antitoxin component of YhaV-PrlF toxin-antitoxin module